jgi:NADH-quinone oxidoreductase subunit H
MENVWTIENVWNAIGMALQNWLAGFLPAWLVTLIMDLLVIVVLLAIGIVAVLILSFLERKVAARAGDRYGPNRWGPYGVLQPFADAIKMLIKEDIVPHVADRFSFNLAPVIVTVGAVMTYAVLPFGRNMVAANLNIGILYFAAVGSLSIIGLLTAGWGSRNKYALISAFRSVAQLITYEVPLALCIICVVMLAGSLSTQDIVLAQQERGWFFLLMPGIFILYFLAASAEMIRCPFDLLEADSEIVAGHFIEYSGMKFALFFLAEYIHLFAGSAMMVTLFFGGWLGPWLPSWLWFLIKTFVVIFVFMWIRNTFPRIRIDQVLKIGWKVMVPAGLVGLAITGFVDKLIADTLIAGVVLFVCNIALILGVSYFMGRAQRQKEMAAEGAALR